LASARELGYHFRQTLAGGREVLIDGYVADLVRGPVNIIVVIGTRESLTAMRANLVDTRRDHCPIGMGSGAKPLGYRLPL
jgi:hypothetical protein